MLYKDFPKRRSFSAPCFSDVNVGRQGDVLDLLRWAIGAQRVLSLGGQSRLLPAEQLAAGETIQRVSVCGAAACQRNGELGTMIDASSVPAAWNVAPDAELVGEVVRATPLAMREELIDYGHTGAPPDALAGAELRAVPMTLDVDRPVCRPVCHRCRSKARQSCNRAVLVFRSRKKAHVGALLTLDPSPARVLAARRRYAVWVAGVDRLDYIFGSEALLSWWRLVPLRRLDRRPWRRNPAQDAVFRAWAESPYMA